MGMWDLPYSHVTSAITNFIVVSMVKLALHFGTGKIMEQC